MWRLIIVGGVLLTAGTARCQYFWHIPWIAKFYKFLAFQSKLEPTEQLLHFFGGVLILPAGQIVVDLIYWLFFGGEWNNCLLAVNADYWYVVIAFTGGAIKEIGDMLVAGKWHRRDSLVDIGFWILGGLAAPLLKPYL